MQIRKGRKLTEEHKEHIRQGVKKHLPSTAFKKGCASLFKGTKTGRVPRSAFKKGQVVPDVIRQKIRESTVGINGNAWDGGKRAWHTKVARAIYYENHTNVICENCGATERLHIHHKDDDWKNHSLDNLSVLCIHCHLSHHRLKDNFGRKRVALW